MSIATEISRLQTAKADIKAAIEAKGVTVPSTAKLDVYDDYIAQISGGSSVTVVRSAAMTETRMWVNSSGTWQEAAANGTNKNYYLTMGAGKYTVVASSMIAIVAVVTAIGEVGDAVSFGYGSSRITLQPFAEQIFTSLSGNILIVRGDKAAANSAIFPTIIYEP